jgi:hypothetical protein
VRLYVKDDLVMYIAARADWRRLSIVGVSKKAVRCDNDDKLPTEMLLHVCKGAELSDASASDVLRHMWLAGPWREAQASLPEAAREHCFSELAARLLADISG